MKLLEKVDVTITSSWSFCNLIHTLATYIYLPYI